MTIGTTVMVMKKRSTNRYSVAEAKAQLAEVLRSTETRPAVIQRRGRDVAVVLSLSDYQRLRDQAGVRPASQWLERLAQWRRRTGGSQFDPAPFVFQAARVDFEGPR